jgi:hypothetical protein
MLPQEVQAMRADQAIVFYEGIRPIRCTKIRYFRERRFKRLIGPPPRHAAPGMKAPPPAPVQPLPSEAVGELGSINIDPAPATSRPSRRRSRRATPEDIERIDELKLENFDVDLSQVELPQKAEGERLTTQELDAAVESFLSALQER